MHDIGLFLPSSEIDRVRTCRSTFCQSLQRTEKMAPGHVNNAIASIGKIFGVADVYGSVQTKARLVDAFVTTFGNPDIRLLEGKRLMNRFGRARFKALG
jgi:hypothetical protein